MNIETALAVEFGYRSCEKGLNLNATMEELHALYPESRPNTPAPATFKVWHCSCRQQWRFGGWKDTECVVVAEIESKALGMALSHYPDTSPDEWTATEILVEEGVNHIYSYGN